MSFFIIGQLATVSHEIGHAIPALMFTEDNVKIILGKRSSKAKGIKIKRFSIEIERFSPLIGSAYWNGNRMSKGQKIITFISGPIISLLIGIGLMLIYKNLKQYLFKQIVLFSAYYHIIQFIITCIPITYPELFGEYAGCTSDGYKALNLIKNS